MSSYNVGDKGPGGGTVFYAEGGKYKECSGELGSGNWSKAKDLAKNHNGGGFSDWMLPNKEELNLMYQNLCLRGLGGFDTNGDSGIYWSSSEYESGYPWYQNFSSGFQPNCMGKDSTWKVRAIRAF